MDREFLKPYRCVGGLLLFVGVFTNILTIFSSPLFALFAVVFSENINFQALLMGINGFVIVYTYYLAYRIFVKKYDKKMIRINLIKKKDILSCIIACLLGFIIIRFTWKIVYLFLNSIKLFDYESNPPKDIFSIFYIVLLAPITEEIVFRGWCINLLKKYGKVVAIIFSSIGFGLFHGNLFQGLSALFVGLVFAYLTIRYESILPSIILHIINNSLAFFPELLFDNKYLYILLIITVLTIVVVFIINIVKGKRLLPGIKMSIKLSYRSISFILFCLFFIFLIVFNFINT